jgi:hypothetical protein
MSNAMSLEKSVRTCSVNVGEANRIQSDRFFNPSSMVCVAWSGLNNKGQVVSPDSFYTKTPGCDSAEDRVMVENAQRPNYMSYVTLGAQGIQGNIYGNMDAQTNAQGRDAFLQDRNNITGNFGKQFGADVAYNSCTVGKDGTTAYERNMAQMQNQLRNQAFMARGQVASSNHAVAGF